MRRCQSCLFHYLVIPFAVSFESPGRLSSGRATSASFTSQIIHVCGHKIAKCVVQWQLVRRISLGSGKEAVSEGQVPLIDRATQTRHKGAIGVGNDRR